MTRAGGSDDHGATTGAGRPRRGRGAAARVRPPLVRRAAAEPGGRRGRVVGPGLRPRRRQRGLGRGRRARRLRHAGLAGGGRAGRARGLGRAGLEDAVLERWETEARRRGLDDAPPGPAGRRRRRPGAAGGAAAGPSGAPAGCCTWPPTWRSSAATCPRATRCARSRRPTSASSTTWSPRPSRPTAPRGARTRTGAPARSTGPT